jgi:hypothetical protein
VELWVCRTGNKQIEILVISFLSNCSHCQKSLLSLHKSVTLTKADDTEFSMLR